jgi:nucleotide-binding universal stress UspA family protein
VQAFRPARYGGAKAPHYDLNYNLTIGEFPAAPGRASGGNPADVIATSGNSPFRRQAGGAEVARRWLFAEQRPTEPDGHFLGEVFMILLKNILVATDFGEPSAKALEYGRDLARTFGATLHVLHVVENVISRYATEFAFVDFPEVQIQVEEAARKQLDGVLDAEDRTALRAKPVLRTSMAPAVAIIDYAKNERIDLIVMGTHGRGAVAHFLMGSVAERVVRAAPCPVLTVHTREREFVGPDALVAVEHAANTAKAVKT